MLLALAAAVSWEAWRVYSATRAAADAASAGTGAGAGRGQSANAPPFQWCVPDAGIWNLFRSGESAAPAPTGGELAARYRLAGVFLMLSGDPGADSENRCAILDNLQTKQQMLGTEGEWLDDVRVVRVESDRVVLSDGEREETILLAAGSLERDGARDADAQLVAGAPGLILESNRFGNRVGDTRWDISREAVLQYAQEVMDSPERTAELFLAMNADWDDEGDVAGYRLNMERGENEFYSLVGFQDGDIIRRVNSMRMVSQRRAEYFIGEFLQDRLGAVVIDIERNGEEMKLVYLIQ